ncbi:hypothetical protein IscW_ISCW009637 [Ixodes scapularis]|uniref:Uncharacterized protein n=1 Tax=Ixodes scapularis TaxID=6945 RepID=B7Q1K2_IXOSC|nr:hypothetical protein IscW_ISCW009637 [Ixodes scapularis]|eukprot:XP_002409733.1 hypothetical protein IscW_ISCW009637 [Ixodes scapularis]
MRAICFFRNRPISVRISSWPHVFQNLQVVRHWHTTCVFGTTRKNERMHGIYPIFLFKQPFQWRSSWQNVALSTTAAAHCFLTVLPGTKSGEQALARYNHVGILQRWQPEG